MGGECDQNILYNIVQEVTKELPNFNLCLTMCGPLCRLCLCLTNVWATMMSMFVWPYHTK